MTPWTAAHQAPLSIGILQARILEWVVMPSSRRIFPTHGSNLGLPHCRWILYQLSHQGSPRILEWVAIGGLEGKASACNVGDLGSIPGLGRCPGEGNCYPLQNPDLENSMDCLVDGVAKSRIGLSDFHFQVMISILASPYI